MTGTNERNAFTDNALGDGGDVLNKINFGGDFDDVFHDVVVVPDGFVAVGYSREYSFETGDWGEDPIVEGFGGLDAIIVKFDFSLDVQWRTNFGGAGDDEFNGVTMVELPDTGYLLIAVGYSDEKSFNEEEGGCWVELGVDGYGGLDAIIVAFDENGTLVTAMNFGGKGDDVFNAVTASSEGNVCAVGYSTEGSFGIGNGSWGEFPDITKHGKKDAIMAVYSNFELSYALNFGGAGDDEFLGVTAFVDGELTEYFFAVGYSDEESFDKSKGGDWVQRGNGDYGLYDAIIVAFSGGVIHYATNFGGAGDDVFRGVGVTASGDVYAVGYSGEDSFDKAKGGSWMQRGDGGNGGVDAIIVEFRNIEDTGVIVFRAMNFGGEGDDFFNGVAVSPEGNVVAVGYSGVFDGEALIRTDAIAVGYDADGIVGAVNFGGGDFDQFNAVVLLPDGAAVVVGHSNADSFGNGDWEGVEAKGAYDATVVIFETGTDDTGNGNGNGGDTGGDNGTVGNGDDDFPLMYVAVAAVGVIAVLGIAYVFVLKKP